MVSEFVLSKHDSFLGIFELRLYEHRAVWKSLLKRGTATTTEFSTFCSIPPVKSAEAMEREGLAGETGGKRYTQKCDKALV